MVYVPYVFQFLEGIELVDRNETLMRHNEIGASGFLHTIYLIKKWILKLDNARRKFLTFL